MAQEQHARRAWRSQPTFRQGDEAQSYTSGGGAHSADDAHTSLKPQSRNLQAPQKHDLDMHVAYDEDRNSSSAKPHGHVPIAIHQSNTTLPAELIQQISEQVRTQVLNDLKADPTVVMPSMQVPRQSGMPPQQTHVLTPPMESYISRNADHDRLDDSEPEIDDIQPDKFAKGREYETRKENLSGRLGDRSVPFEERNRPSVRRTLTGDEETALERAWQPLFDEGGLPTSRFDQFLRGLALDIVEEFEPKNSLVIAPSKMLHYYEQMEVDLEPYPWRYLFELLPHDKLSRIYLALGCQHHYISASNNAVPTVPALTPTGFATWTTLLVQAHPGIEFDRLTKAIQHMAVSNADERSERFPKQLTRRLLPRSHHVEARRRCDAVLLPPKSAVGFDGQCQTNDASSFPAAGQGSSVSKVAGDNETGSTATLDLPRTVNERARTPYSVTVPGMDSWDRNDHVQDRVMNQGLAQDSISIDHVRRSESVTSAAEEIELPRLSKVESGPIERERRPYVAREGQGKVHCVDRASFSDASLRPPVSFPQPDATGGRRRAESIGKGSYAYALPSHISPPSSLPSHTGSGFGSSLGRSNSVATRRTAAGIFLEPGSYRRERSPGSVASSNGAASATSSAYIPPAVESDSDEADVDVARSNASRESRAMKTSRYAESSTRADEPSQSDSVNSTRVHAQAHRDRPGQRDIGRDREVEDGRYMPRAYDRRGASQVRARERDDVYGRTSDLRRERDRAEQEYMRARDERNRYDMDTGESSDLDYNDGSMYRRSRRSTVAGSDYTAPQSQQPSGWPDDRRRSPGRTGARGEY